jgi:hypothetical protein
LKRFWSRKARLRSRIGIMRGIMMMRRMMMRLMMKMGLIMMKMVMIMMMRGIMMMRRMMMMRLIMRKTQTMIRIRTRDEDVDGNAGQSRTVRLVLRQRRALNTRRDGGKLKEEWKEKKEKG